MESEMIQGELTQPNRAAPLSIWKIFCSEWMYWAAGAVFVFLLANTQMSGPKSGVIPDLSAPYAYGGDLLFHSWLIQRVIEGWPFENPRSGYPFGSSLLDYPGSDIGNHLLLKLLGYLGGDFQSALNLYFLLGFAITFVAAYLVLRALGLSVRLSLAGGVIFDLLPFHFMRLPHLFLTWYFVAPIFFYLGFVCFSSGSKEEWLGGRKRLVFPILGLLIAASFGVYYSLFGVIVLVVAGLAGAVAYRTGRPLVLSGIYASAVAVGVLLNVAPNVLYQQVNGPNPEVAHSQPNASEIYGLKLVQLVMPRQGHRSKSLAALTNYYSQTFPLVNENATSALGVIGAAGLLSLMAVIAVRLAGREVEVRISLLALIVLVLFMFGSIGGLGTLFSLFVSPAIRGWNRISVFIGFGAITGLLMFIQMGIKRYTSPANAALTELAVAAALVVLAFFDQMTPPDPTFSTSVKTVFNRDHAFVENIEAQLPPGAAIYQLPYVGFPETVPPYQLGHYDLLTGFIQSKTLRWSHGGMKGRPGDLFFRSLSQEPIARQLEVVRRLGFSGIYIDRRGYEDQGLQIVTQLTAELGYGPSLGREDGQVAFFRLENVDRVSLEGRTATEIMERAGYVVDRLGVRYQANFEDGIDFMRPGWPSFVRQAAGLSEAEPWGRWSDENVAPAVRFDFTSELPDRFVLVLSLLTFGPNAQQPMVVKVGDTTYKVVLPAGEGILRLAIQGHNHSSFIELYPPRPTSPAELKLSSDARRLAVGFRKLKIEHE
jgi:phosphoglycerol transferase